MLACAHTAKIVLFVLETGAYFASDLRTTVEMDGFGTGKIQLNFNITMHDLACDYAVINLVDKIGTQQVLFEDVKLKKVRLDGDGGQRLHHKNERDHAELNHDHEDHPPLHVLHENGVHAVDLVTGSWDDFIKGNELAFVDFYAPWCIWCQRAAPTWEKFAEEVERASDLPVAVAKVRRRPARVAIVPSNRDPAPLPSGQVNCPAEPALCAAQRVMAFPTMRFYSVTAWLSSRNRAG